jgi:hypothetical protein
MARPGRMASSKPPRPGQSIQISVPAPMITWASTAGAPSSRLIVIRPGDDSSAVVRAAMSRSSSTGTPKRYRATGPGATYRCPGAAQNWIAPSALIR